MSLPAGAMISLVTALEGRCTLWPRAGAPREMPAVDFVTGNHMNVLGPGELLRKVHLPASALLKRTAFRQASLTKLGRSAALLLGTSDPTRQDLLLTVTAATPRPVQLRLDEILARGVPSKSRSPREPGRAHRDHDVNRVGVIGLAGIE